MIEKISFIEIVKATRIQRTLTALATLMIPVAFANVITKEIYLLALVCILIYAAASIQNAKRDNDYNVSKYANISMGFFLVLGLLVSLNHFVLFITFIAWLGLGYFYNTLARLIMLGDVTVLAFTHHTLPVISSSILLGLPMRITAGLSLFMFVTFWFIIHIKNLKDVKEDKKRGYSTITGKGKVGYVLTKSLFELSFAFMIAAYFLFNLSVVYLYVIVGAFVLKAVITYLVDMEHEELALMLARLMAIIFLLGMVMSRSDNGTIIAISFGIGVVYLFFLVFDLLIHRTSTKDAVGV